MAKKSVKKSAKKPMSKMDSKMNKMDMDSCCKKGWHYTWVKLSAIAFILFLITVWPALMQLVQKIHWAWFLAATIILCIITWTRGCRKSCC